MDAQRRMAKCPFNKNRPFLILKHGPANRPFRSRRVPLQLPLRLLLPRAVIRPERPNHLLHLRILLPPRKVRRQPRKQRA